jgi:hypothetical protein
MIRIRRVFMSAKQNMQVVGLITGLVALAALAGILLVR